MQRLMIEAFMTRKLSCLALMALLLAGCAALKPDPNRHDQEYVCKPGSAVKYRVEDGRAYPRDMRWKGGSCAFQGMSR
jgi:hypothetical protein